MILAKRNEGKRSNFMRWVSKVGFCRSALLVVLLFVVAMPRMGQESPKNARGAENIITNFEIDKSKNHFGSLFITYGGKKRKIADSAYNAWIINDGKEIVYSDSEGAGGFENEGQGLRIYEAAINFTQKIMAEYFPIYAVKEVKLSSGKRLLLVRGHHGGNGDSQFAVVDPKRGEIFYRKHAEVTAISGDRITLGFFYGSEFECTNENKAKCDRRNEEESSPNRLILQTSVNPFKKETYDLKDILKKEVIYNEKDRRLFEEERKNLKKTVVYMWHGYQDALVPLPRYVEQNAPLQLTLEALFSKPSSYEEELGYSSPTFGLKLEGVALEKGVATIRFSQPPHETNYGTSGPFLFYKAVEKTAKQFSKVKLVEICAIGRTFIDSELTEPFPKCGEDEVIKYREKAVPIVRLQMLLGWSYSGKWIMARKGGPKLEGQNEFVPLDLNKSPDNKKIVNTNLREECFGVQIIEFGKNRDYRTMIGSNATWNPMPRRATKLNRATTKYRKIVADFLKTKGINETKISLNRAIKVDLEGDAEPELLLEASYFKNGLEKKSSIGDYSFVLLLKRVDGEFRSILLDGDFYTGKDRQHQPSKHGVSTIADLNGDGKMEIGLSSSFYERNLENVFEITGVRASLVLFAECIA